MSGGLSYCCPANTVITAGKCVCNSTTSYYTFSGSNLWTCVLAATCTTANGTVSGTNCTCNNGYTASISNNTGTLTAVCTCGAGLSVINSTVNYCCPTNATVSGTTCGCNAASG